MVRPVAILVTPAIAAEITLLDGAPDTDVRRGQIGEDQVDVLIGRSGEEDPRPIAMLVTDWMREHLYLYARELWHRPRAH